MSIKPPIDSLVIKEIVKNLRNTQKERLSIAVLLSGNGKNLQALIDYTKKEDCSFFIETVITNNPKSLAKERALTHGLPFHVVDHKSFASKHEFEHTLLSVLKNYNVDLVVLACFMRVLSKTFLRDYEKRIINLHPSLLPQHPGLNAIEKALNAKEERTGCTVHLVDEGLDTGPIIAQSSCPIFHSDTVTMVTERIKTLEHALLSHVINAIANEALLNSLSSKKIYMASEKKTTD